MKENWITVDYLEIFCEKNKSVIRCHRGEDEMWISPLGSHPSTLTSEEVLDILKESSLFEIRRVIEEDLELVESQFLSRADLEKQIRRMMN